MTPSCEPLPVPIAAAIAARHGLTADRVGARPWVGATSCVHPLGAVVIKVPHNDGPALDALRIDALVAPIARAAGVRTPRLVAFDDRRDLVPRPYAVYERVPGQPLARFGPPDEAQAAWRELGRDLAVVHEHLHPEGALADLRSFQQSPAVDPRPWVDELAGAGGLTVADARWLASLLDRLAAAALAPVPRRLCHGDVNAANVLVAATTGSCSYLAVIDWAGAGWLDPAWDFAAVPLRAVPYLLEGHRRQAPLPDDATAEARVLWCHVQHAVYLARGLASVADRSARLARLLDGARWFGRRAGFA